MDECESLESEMTELPEFQCEGSDTISQDDEDEVEELQNSLREVVQDQSVKPKFQCLMVDPSFSMVTVQSEDSGIVWETASSRCSTPWASETSSVSEAYSMDGSGAAGKITIVFDEEKIIRRRTRSGGRSSRLGDRLSRPGSSRSASALGVERLEMAEVSLPNVRQEKTETEPDLDEIKNKDQQLFSLISEGYEILNIRVPSKLPTVDEEESTDLQDNLSYLDQTPKIRSRNHHDCTQQQNHVLPEEGEILDHQQASEEDSSQPPPDTELTLTPTPTDKESTSDIDYFEKFTLVDVVVPGEQAPKLQEAEQLAAKPQIVDQKPAKDATTESPSALEDSFVLVTDVEIFGEHLDEVFYGEGAPADALQRRDDDGAEMRKRRESQRSGKENGSVLFGSEETILTPIFISPGPPKIIDQILLDEPTAMSFMYSDLYEDAVGERRKSDEERSEAESAASEKSYRRRLSDSEEASGYLEKFILKDETPTVEVQPESVKDRREGRMMWLPGAFEMSEMSGCLTRVVKEEAEDKTKTQQISVGDESEDLKSVASEEKRELVPETEKANEEIQFSRVTEEETVRDDSEESIQESKLREDQMLDQEVKQDSERGQSVHHESSSDEPPPRNQHVESKEVESKKDNTDYQREVPEDTVSTEQLCQRQEVVAATSQEDVNTEETVMAASGGREVPHITDESEITTETAEEVPTDAAMAADEKVVPEAPANVEELELKVQEMLICAEIETAAETSLCEEEGAAEVVAKEAAPVEVSTDSDAAVVEVTEKAVDVKEIGNQVELDLQEVRSVETTHGAPVEVITDCDAAVHAAVEVPEIETSAEKSPCEEKGAAQVAVKDVAPVEVITDCAAAVRAVVEVTEKAVDVKEIQTQVKIELQDIRSVETTDVQTAVPKGEEYEALTKETVVERQAPESLTEADHESEVKPETSSEVRTDSDEKEQHLIESKKHQQEDTVTASESDKTKLIPEATKDTGSDQEMVNVGDELILLVPKGQAVEMDIELSQWPEETSDTVVPSQPDSTGLMTPETTSICPETVQASDDEIITQPHLEEKPEAIVEEVALPDNELDERYPPAPVEEANTEEQAVDFENDEGFLSPLRSFTPLEDLSGLHREEMKAEAAEIEEEAEMHKEEEEDAPETNIAEEDSGLETRLCRDDAGPEMEQIETVAEPPEVIVEELGYEMISEQDAEEMPELKAQRDAEEPKPESGQETEDRIEIDVDTKEEEKLSDLPPEEDLIEDDYEIIDAEEESQARLAAELQGMDWFCLTCGCLLSEDACVSGEHHSHQVTAVDKAYEEIKDKLSDWISALQGRSENIEDLVSELELAYNSVEDQCVETEAAMQVQNEEMMALVMEQYNNMSVSMEEEKKAKLEQLYDQIVSFQESIDSAKATLETTVREAETDARSPEDIHARLKAALDSAMSLELGPKGLLVFEDYAKGNTSSSQHTQRKGIPVPQSPTLQLQEPGSASSTSVTVYWKVNPGDIIDCFQVYCMEDPLGAVSEEYRVTVKESYCVLEELEPDKTYKVWVMAVNYTGCSLPSERLAFRTAPSVPVIDTERCTVMWDSATLRWSSVTQTPEQSYILEYCRQYELEGEGLRSISGIRGCEQKVLLQPSENYLFYIKAVNEAGASEQSEAALISTKGTRFHLLKSSAHPALELSLDQSTLHYSQDAHENTPSTDKQCPSILGELLLGQGRYYWETIVSGSTAYRLGVAYSTANRISPLGENSLSWCLQCIPTPSGCRYQLLHNDVESSVLVTELPERVGVLLDYQLDRLSFYNAQSGQMLGSFCQHFTQPCHPALALEMPGSLEVRMVLEVPEFTKDS